MQSLLLTLQLKPQETCQQTQTDRLHPVQLGEHTRSGLLEVALREHFKLGPEARRPREITVRIAGLRTHGGGRVRMSVQPQSSNVRFQGIQSIF